MHCTQPFLSVELLLLTIPQLAVMPGNTKEYDFIERIGSLSVTPCTARHIISRGKGLQERCTDD